MEVLLHLFVRLGEERRALALNLARDAFEVLARLAQVAELFRKELEALFHLLELLGCGEVHRTERTLLLAKLRDARPQIGRRSGELEHPRFEVGELPAETLTEVLVEIADLGAALGGVHLQLLELVLRLSELLHAALEPALLLDEVLVAHRNRLFELLLFELHLLLALAEVVELAGEQRDALSGLAETLAARVELRPVLLELSLVLAYGALALRHALFHRGDLRGHANTVQTQLLERRTVLLDLRRERGVLFGPARDVRAAAADGLPARFERRVDFSLPRDDALGREKLVEKGGNARSELVERLGDHRRLLFARREEQSGGLERLLLRPGCERVGEMGSVQSDTVRQLVDPRAHLRLELLARPLRVARLREPLVELLDDVVGELAQTALELDLALLLRHDLGLVLLDPGAILADALLGVIDPLLERGDIGVHIRDSLAMLGDSLAERLDLGAQRLDLAGERLLSRLVAANLLLELTDALAVDPDLVLTVVLLELDAVEAFLMLDQPGFHRVDDVEVLFKTVVYGVNLGLQLVARRGLALELFGTPIALVDLRSQLEKREVELGLERLVAKPAVGERLLGLLAQALVAARDLAEDAL
ncbi:MAG: hypothetical protein ACOC7V_16785, partial [Spirochaetota bacterium]